MLLRGAGVCGGRARRSQPHSAAGTLCCGGPGVRAAVVRRNGEPSARLNWRYPGWRVVATEVCIIVPYLRYAEEHY
jgi:hypothetical protein